MKYNKKRGNQMNFDKHKRFLIQFAYYGVIIALGYLFVKYLLRYVWPFIIGWLIASLFKKPIKYVTDKFNIKRGVVSTIILLIFYSAIVTLAVVLSIQLATWIINYASKIPQLYSQSIEPTLYKAYNAIQEFFANLDSSVADNFRQIFQTAISKLGEWVTNFSMTIVSLLSGYITKIPKTIVSILMTIISSVIIAIDYDKINLFIIHQFTDEQKHLIYEVKDYLIGTVFACLRSYVLIMLITFVELSLGFLIFGMENGLVIAAITAILDIMPILGSGTVLIPWAVISFIIGEYVRGIELLVMYIVITVIRQIIEPHLVGQQMGLHPIVTLGSMYIGTQVFGALGLFGMPILLSVLNHLNQKGIIYILK